MLRPALLAAVLPLIACAQESRGESRPVPSGEDVMLAVTEATKLLCGGQENYVETRAPRTRFKTDEERKAFEEKEKEAQLAKSKEVGPPREWPYEGVYRVAGLIPPGYRVGGTSIVCRALLESPGFENDAPRKEIFARGIAFVLDSLEKDPLLQSGFEGNYDVRGWAHTYGLGILLRALERGALDAKTAARAKKAIPKLIKTLDETAIVENGGWNYARGAGPQKPNPPSTFMTAPTLQVLFDARKQGYDVPEPMIQRGLKTLEDARLETGAFQYAASEKKTGKGFEAVPGACARMAVCETTLFLAGRGSVDRIRTAVQAFFEHWEWLEKRRRQQGTHIPPYYIAPYYFHYAHTYVAQAIEQLPESERPALRDQLRALYWKTREPDGGWNDRVFPRSEGFGTAMAILGLMMPKLPPPARLEPSTKTASRPSK